MLERSRLAPSLHLDRFDYDPVSELEQSRCFTDVDQQLWPFEVSYSAGESLTLIDTYASHQALDTDRRRRLGDRLRSAIEDDLGGNVTKPYEALLVLGRRRP